MPTKTKDKSPLEIAGLAGTLVNVAKAVGPETLAKAAGPVAKKGLGALLGGALKANPIGAAITGAKGLVGGFKEMLGDRKAALAAGEEYKFGEGLKDFGAGALKGATGIDLTDQQAAPKPTEYTSNIDPMTGQEIPLTMTGKPLKMLTGVKGNIPHNMSAAQYKSGLKMQEISGAAPLQANAFYASLNAAKEAGRDTFEVDGKEFKVK